MCRFETGTLLKFDDDQKLSVHIDVKSLESIGQVRTGRSSSPLRHCQFHGCWSIIGRYIHRCWRSCKEAGSRAKCKYFTKCSLATADDPPAFLCAERLVVLRKLIV